MMLILPAGRLISRAGAETADDPRVLVSNALNSLESALKNPKEAKTVFNRLALARKSVESIRDPFLKARLYSCLGLMYAAALGPDIAAGSGVDPEKITALAEEQFSSALKAAGSVSSEAQADAAFLAGVGMHLIRNSLLAAGEPEPAAKAHQKTIDYLRRALMLGTRIPDARPLYKAVRDQGAITPVAWIQPAQALDLVYMLLEKIPKPGREQTTIIAAQKPPGETTKPPGETAKPPGPAAAPAPPQPFADDKWGFRITPPGPEWKQANGPFPEPVRFSSEMFLDDANAIRPNLQVSAAIVDDQVAKVDLLEIVNQSKKRLSDAGSRIVKDREIVIGGIKARELIITNGKIMQTLITYMYQNKIYIITGTDTKEHFESAYPDFQKAVESFAVF